MPILRQIFVASSPHPLTHNHMVPPGLPLSLTAGVPPPTLNQQAPLPPPLCVQALETQLLSLTLEREALEKALLQEGGEVALLKQELDLQVCGHVCVQEEGMRACVLT